MDHIELALSNLLRVLINLDFILCILNWSTLHFIFFIMMISWRCTWEFTQSFSSRHTIYRLNPYYHSLDHSLNKHLDHHIIFYIYIFLQPLNENMVQALYMDKSYKYNSMQILVHRDCHQLPKPRMGVPCSFKKEGWTSSCEIHRCCNKIENRKQEAELRRKQKQRLRKS
jgi:hypothetical protein